MNFYLIKGITMLRIFLLIIKDLPKQKCWSTHAQLTINQHITCLILYCGLNNLPYVILFDK